MSKLKRYGRAAEDDSAQESSVSNLAHYVATRDRISKFMEKVHSDHVVELDESENSGDHEL